MTRPASRRSVESNGACGCFRTGGPRPRGLRRRRAAYGRMGGRGSGVERSHLAIHDRAGPGPPKAGSRGYQSLCLPRPIHRWPVPRIEPERDDGRTRCPAISDLPRNVGGRCGSSVVREVRSPSNRCVPGARRPPRLGHVGHVDCQRRGSRGSRHWKSPPSRGGPCHDRAARNHGVTRGSVGASQTRPAARGVSRGVGDRHLPPGACARAGDPPVRPRLDMARDPSLGARAAGRSRRPPWAGVRTPTRGRLLRNVVLRPTCRRLRTGAR